MATTTKSIHTFLVLFMAAVLAVTVDAGWAQLSLKHCAQGKLHNTPYADRHAAAWPSKGRGSIPASKLVASVATGSGPGAVLGFLEGNVEICQGPDFSSEACGLEL